MFEDQPQPPHNQQGDRPLNQPTPHQAEVVGVVQDENRSSFTIDFNQQEGRPLNQQDGRPLNRQDGPPLDRQDGSLNQKRPSRPAEVVVLAKRKDDLVELHHRAILSPEERFKSVPDFGENGAAALREKLNTLTKAYTDARENPDQSKEIKKQLVNHVREWNRSLGKRGSVSLNIDTKTNSDGSFAAHSFSIKANINFTKREINNYVGALEENKSMRDVTSSLDVGNKDHIVAAKADGDPRIVEELIKGINERVRPDRSAVDQRALNERARSREMEGVGR